DPLPPQPGEDAGVARPAPDIPPGWRAFGSQRHSSAPALPVIPSRLGWGRFGRFILDLLPPACGSGFVRHDRTVPTPTVWAAPAAPPAAAHPPAVPGRLPRCPTPPATTPPAPPAW